MRTMLVETYKIKSKNLVSEHDRIMDEWIRYIISKAEIQGWKKPIHSAYSIQGEGLGRMFMVIFESHRHQVKWMDAIRDDEFNKYNDQFLMLVENFGSKYVTETWSL